MLGTEGENFLSVSTSLKLPEQSLHDTLTAFFNRFMEDLTLVDENFIVFERRFKNNQQLNTKLRSISNMMKGTKQVKYNSP